MPSSTITSAQNGTTLNHNTVDINLDDILSVAKEAALKAGKLIRDVFDQEDRREAANSKSNAQDLFTDIDVKSEEIISSMIISHFPTHSIIGEETVGTTRYTLGDEPTWFIDPIDGTTNFVHQIPGVCVLITFAIHKIPVVHVTYNPLEDELFWAQKGQGAYMKSKSFEGRIKVTGTTTIAKSIIGTEVGYGRSPEITRQVSNDLTALMLKQVRSIRVLGSCGINVTLVARGIFDACYERGCWDVNQGPKIWDFAGGKLLVEEAGGVMIDPSGAPFNILGRGLLAAASQELADEIVSAWNVMAPIPYSPIQRSFCGCECSSNKRFRDDDVATEDGGETIGKAKMVCV